VHVHDTYFVVAHFHYVMVGGTIMAYLAAALLVAEDQRPDVPGGLGQVRGARDLRRFNLTFFPQFVVGYMGMPRRYHMYPEDGRC